MKKIITCAILITSLLIFCQCSKLEIKTNDDIKIENIPETSNQLGILVAKELNSVVKNLHKQGIDYSKANEIENFKEKFKIDFLKASPSHFKTKSFSPESEIFSQKIINNFNCLTKIQNEYINKIILECSTSKSYSEFYERLAQINNDIIKSVPKIQQERLYNVTSVLYHVTKEFQNLEILGLMIPTPQNRLNNLTKSDWGTKCKSILATSWTVALAEPTPVGEVIASIVTTGLIVYIAGEALYEYIICTKSADDKENDAYCRERFEKCTSSILDGCSKCLEYCMFNGVWPPYFTHKCS